MRGGSEFGDVEEGNQSRSNKIDTNEYRYLSPCTLLFISSDAHLLGPFAFSPSHSQSSLNISNAMPLLVYTLRHQTHLRIMPLSIPAANREYSWGMYG